MSLGPGSLTTLVRPDGTLVRESGAASEEHIGQVGGTTKIATAFLVRPNDTTAYAVGDLIGAQVAAGAANVLGLDAARINGGSGRIIRLRGSTNDPDFVGTIRFHLMKALAVPVVGDNAPLSKAVPGYAMGYGYADIVFSGGAVANNIFSDGSKGYAALMPAVAFDVMPDTRMIYALAEVRTVFTPKAIQRIGLSLELDLD